jgi:sialic acid synthase SpsE
MQELIVSRTLVIVETGVNHNGNLGIALRLVDAAAESGVVTTNDDRLAERVQLIRNHAETVVESKRNVAFLEMMRPGMTKADLEDVAAAFHRVSGQLDASRQ